MKKRILALVVTCALVLCVPAIAFAASAAFDSPSTAAANQAFTEEDEYTGNVFAAEESLSDASIPNDYYWAGAVFEGKDLVIGSSGKGSALMAGQSISLSNSVIADSLRVAGELLEFNNLEVGNNLTLAGSIIKLGSNVNGNGLYVAGDSVEVAGTYNAVAIAASEVTLSASVAGDVQIAAPCITIEQNAVIEGTLTVPEDAQLTIVEGARVADTVYETPLVSTSEEDSLYDTLLQMVYACMAHVLLVGLFAFAISGTILNAANMSKTRLKSIFLSGLLVFILAPFAVLALLFPLVTIPISVMLLMLMVFIWLFSIPFAGSVLGIRLFHQMNSLGAAVAGTVILTILCYALPFMILIVPALTSIFTTGYLVQKLIDRRKQIRHYRNQSVEAQAQVQSQTQEDEKVN